MRIIAGCIALLLIAASHAARTDAASERVLARWKLSIQIVNETYAEQLTAERGALVLSERAGPIGASPTRATRMALPFSAIGCVAATRMAISIYPIKRWGVSSKNLATGKISPGSKIALTFSDAGEAQSALRALESASPQVKSKLGACKSDVDLYGLRFGGVPSKNDPFRWTRNSMLGASRYTLWVDAGTLYEEDSDSGIGRNAAAKMPLSGIGCVRVSPGSKDLAPSLGIVSALPNNVLNRQSMGSGKPGVFTTGGISLSFDDEATQQSALQYLEAKDPALAARVNAPC